MLHHCNWSPLFATRVDRANLRKAQGTLTATVLGTAAPLVHVKSFEIEVPAFLELRVFRLTRNRLP
jgi:hypothetical protein